MQKNDYLGKKQADKQNIRHLTSKELDRIKDYECDLINKLKIRWYTSPKDYGKALANHPRHAHAKGRRVLHTTNF